MCEALHSQAALTGKGTIGVKSSQLLGVLQNADCFPCRLLPKEIGITEPANHSCCSPESLKAAVESVVHCVSGALERCAAAILPLQVTGYLEVQTSCMFPLCVPLLLGDGGQNTLIFTAGKQNLTDLSEFSCKLCSCAYRAAWLAAGKPWCSAGGFQEVFQQEEKRVFFFLSWESWQEMLLQAGYLQQPYCSQLGTPLRAAVPVCFPPASAVGVSSWGLSLGCGSVPLLQRPHSFGFFPPQPSEQQLLSVAAGLRSACHITAPAGEGLPAFGCFFWWALCQTP